MTGQTVFNGFTEEFQTFFQELSVHNEKSWFDRHREMYERAVMEPSRLLVGTLGAKLCEIRSGTIADPRVNRSLFRLNRDTRFSTNKLPYKTHMGILFWEGDQRLASPCFYLQVTPSSVMFAAGIYQFMPDQLERYREAVDNRQSGEALADILDDILQAGYDLGEPHYKRVPRGFSADHPRRELLKRNGLGAMKTEDIPPSFYTADFVEYCLGHFRTMDPVNGWIAHHLM